MTAKHKLSKIGLYAYVIGTTIGSGIFITLPAAISFTGRSVILAIIVASLTYFLACFYTCAVSSLVPVKGGEYGCITFASPNSLPGVYGIVTLVFCISNSMYAAGALSYFSIYIPYIAPYIKVLTIAVLAIFIIIDYFGLELGAKVENILTGVLLISIALFIIFGLSSVDYTAYVSNPEPFFSNGAVGFSKAVGMCLWVVGGVGMSAVNFCRDVKNPTKTIPKCILGVTAFMTFIAVLICIVCTGTVPIEQAAQGMDVVAKAILPEWLFAVFVIGGAGFALLSSLQGYTLGYRICMLDNATDGFLPKAFTKKTKTGYPWVIGLTIFLLGAVPYIFNLSLDTIVAYCGAPVYILMFYVNICCMQLPKKYPELWKKSMFHMPLHLWYVFTGLSAAAGLYLVYCYCCDYSLPELCTMAVTIACMFGWGYYRIKANYVDNEKYRAKNQRIIDESIAYEEA